ncbi:S41 family peptidase [Massilia oculi]|uniref:S41 family peptidase n=1 Tax=Massilia oculi TaxID=945844 RepID=UPI0028A9F3E4|nr:S41 family peptidase [Massilia oculi]
MMLSTAASAAADGMKVDATTRSGIVRELAQAIDDQYVFPDEAKLVVERLEAKEKSGAYAGISTLEELASVLTADVREPTRDLHLRVRVSAQPLPEIPPETTPEMEKVMLGHYKASNFGVRKIETLPGNIGYIDLRMFASVGAARDVIGAAMQVVADTDALIVDLRNNGGGDPHTVAFMSSYLFDKRTHLNDMVWRHDGSRESFWTQDEVPGKRFGSQKKIYVLTSKKTFSGAEEFSYNMQQLKRATLVGETTGGGAHPGGMHRLNPHLSVFIPRGRAVNPISKSNWEGTGVIPDVPVAADDALRTAERLALTALLQQPRDAMHADQLRKCLAEVDKQGKAG